MSSQPAPQLSSSRSAGSRWLGSKGALFMRTSTSRTAQPCATKPQTGARSFAHQRTSGSLKLRQRERLRRRRLGARSITTSRRSIEDMIAGNDLSRPPLTLMPDKEARDAHQAYAIGSYATHLGAPDG